MGEGEEGMRGRYEGSMRGARHRRLEQRRLQHHVVHVQRAVDVREHAAAHMRRAAGLIVARPEGHFWLDDRAEAVLLARAAETRGAAW
eukprot:7300379-Prymnesium_polylepis.1